MDKWMKRGYLFVLAVSLAALASCAEPLPKVWMSARWREPFEETVRACAEQGVDAIEVPSWSTNHCAQALAALRKYNVKGFTGNGDDPFERVSGSTPFERAVFNGGAYRGKSIDRTFFSFEPKVYDIVVEPPVYSARQGYTSRKKRSDGKTVVVKSGHYFNSYVPMGDAEIIVPQRPFDGQPHVRIIPCKVLPVEPGMKPENDTVTPKLSGPEIENRRLVRLKFNLSDCAGMMLDKVGIAVYWASDIEGDAWSEQNDHDGSGQELLARELDFIHIDPYPVGRTYNNQAIPFDMGYMSGIARRYGKPLVPWMQAHSYAPNGLGNITPSDMKRMWKQHSAFAPDAIMWLGFDMKPGKSDTEMTFPKGSPESWAYAKELFAVSHTALPVQKPVATIAVLRPYSTRAICCAQGAGWDSWRNSADRILEAYVRAWSVDNGLFYDVFELSLVETFAEKTALVAELKKYPYVVSTISYPGVRILGT